MVEGVVTEDLALVFPLTLRSVNGEETQVEVTLDTGFDDYLTLPVSLINALGFPYIIPIDGVLADGSTVASAYYGATILWNNAARKLPVIASENKPLGGMRLIRGCVVRFTAESGQPLFIDYAASNENTGNAT